MPHLSPGVPGLSVITELVKYGSFRRVILVEDEEPIVDRSPWALLEFPVIPTFQKGVEARHNLLEGLVDRVYLLSKDTRVCLGNSFAEKDDSLVCADEIKGILKKPRALMARQMDERFRSLVPICSGFLGGCCRLGGNLRIANGSHHRPAVRPRHGGEPWNLILLLDSANKLSRMQLELFTALAVATLQSVQSLIEGEPRAFMDTQAQEDIVPRVQI